MHPEDMMTTSTYSTKETLGRALPGAVVLQNRLTFGPCAVESLAADGITFLGGPAAGLVPGEVSVVLAVADGGLMKLDGVFRRADVASGKSPHWHVAFQHPSPDIEDSIQQILVEQIERARVPLVVALDGCRLGQTRLRRDLCRLGRDIVFFDSAREALAFMDDAPDRFSSIVVDIAFLRTHGPEVISLLHDRWPDKPCLLACNRDAASEEEIRRLRPVVDGILEMPWTETSLETLFGIPMPESAIPPRRILFVDDEPAVLQGLQRRMRKYLVGCEAVWSTSGQDALTEFRARPFDVIVTDLRMPDMDGATLLRRVKESSPWTRRIVLSGYDLTDSAGVADAVLHKPCPTEVLRDAVWGAS
jgi:CheY-like chemotaxis protein